MDVYILYIPNFSFLAAFQLFSPEKLCLRTKTITLGWRSKEFVTIVPSSTEPFMANVLCSVKDFWGKLQDPSSGPKKIKCKGEESDAPLSKSAHTGEECYEGSLTSLSFSFNLYRRSVPLLARLERAALEYWFPGWIVGSQWEAEKNVPQV